MNRGFIHPRAEIHPSVVLDMGAGVTIYYDVIIGEGSMVQGNVYIPPGVTIGKKVFLGPCCVFTNDKYPFANNPDFQPMKTIVEDGANIGANATILPGLTIGAKATIGAGSVVTKNIPAGETWAGNPARRLK